MVQFFLALTAALSAFFRSRTDALEILALRQQLAVLKRKHPRPRLNICDRLFWTALLDFSPELSQALTLETCTSCVVVGAAAERAKA